jgi:hypothetical protein
MPQRSGALGVEFCKLRMPAFIVVLLLVTVVMAVAAWYGVASINLSGMPATNFTAAQVIRERCPFHVVRPEWVASKDETDILLN